MIGDPLRPAVVLTGYRAAEDGSGNAMRFHGRQLYVQVDTCPSCHEELSESGRDRWSHCPFCGREIRWK